MIEIYIMIGDMSDISYTVLGHFAEDEKSLLFPTGVFLKFLKSESFLM